MQGIDLNILNEGRFQVDSPLKKTKLERKAENALKRAQKEEEREERKAYNAWVKEDRKRSLEKIKKRNKKRQEEQKAALKIKRAKDRAEQKAIRHFERFGDKNIRGLYTYPPKFTVKWDSVDELSEDLFLERNYGSVQHSLPFIDYLEDFLFVGKKQDIEFADYTIDEYREGYLNNLATSSFYSSKTNPIPTVVNKIPVYTIVNAFNEIITAKMGMPPDGIAKNVKDVAKGFSYNALGAFDNAVEQVNEVGFFFMNYEDAEKCLEELAGSDIYGLDAVGAAINCIGLDCAYKVTREYHPRVDFRFVPSYKEVTEVLSKHIGKPNMVVEDEQQQLRFRRRAVPVMDRLGKYGDWLTPWNSFMQRDEYFKGVPIYIVQSRETPRSLFTETYFKMAGVMDGFSGRFIQWLDGRMGFGQNWIMQGSILDAGHSEQFKTHVFFKRSQAVKFANSLGRRAARYEGARSDNFTVVVRKPRILVYNLEDFLERWEDSLVDGTTAKTREVFSNICDPKRLRFIPPENFTQNFVESKEEDPWLRTKQTFAARVRHVKNIVAAVFEVQLDS